MTAPTTSELIEWLKTPRFGDIIENGWASERNPTRVGFFVREGRRTGRMNPGRYFEVTNGAGKFWELPLDRDHKITVRPGLQSIACRLADLERERDQWKERAGFLWTAPDVDAWGRAAEAKGLPLRDKINGLLRRAFRAGEAALAAERSLEEAKGVIEPFAKAADAMQPPIGEYIGRDGIRGTLMNADFRKARAFLNRSAADGEGYGSPRPTLNADEGPGTNPQPDKSREGT